MWKNKKKKDKEASSHPGRRPKNLLVDDSSGVLVLVLRAGQDRVGQVYIQLVIVLDQRDVLVVEHQVLEGRVQVVRLGESVTCGRLVDDAVLGVAVHAAEEKEQRREVDRHRVILGNKASGNKLEMKPRSTVLVPIKKKKKKELRF